MAWSNIKLIARNEEISFLSFCLDLAELVGDAELPLDFQSTTLKGIIKPLDDAFNPLKQCLIDIYKQCHCHSLNSSICPIITLDILGNRCYELKRRSSGVDIKDIDLFEQIGLYLVKFYLLEIQELRSIKRSVVRLDWYKTRRANQKKSNKT